MRRAVITMAAVLSMAPAASFARTWAVRTEAGENTRSLQREGVWSRKQSSPAVGRLMVGGSQRATYLWYLRHAKPGDRAAVPKTMAEQRRLMQTLQTVHQQIAAINKRYGKDPLDPGYRALLQRLNEFEKRLLYILELTRDRDKFAKRLRGRKGIFDEKRKARWEPKVAARQSMPKTDAQLRGELRQLRRLEGRHLTVFTRPVANPLRVLWNTSALALAPRAVPRIPGSPRRWVIAPAF
jgi:hypothetical protein